MQEEIEHRPLLAVALSLTVGLAGAHELPLLVFWIVLVVWLRPRLLKITVACAGLVGLLLAPIQHKTGLLEPTFVSGEAMVASVPISRGGGIFTTLGLGSMKVLADIHGLVSLDLGDRVQVRGLVDPLKEGMDGWALPQGILGVMRLGPAQVQMLSRGPWYSTIAGEWRRGFFSMTEAQLRPDTAALLDSLCFGSVGNPDAERRDALQRTGTVHLIAASGLHVLILAAMLYALFALLPVSRAIAVGAVAVLLVLYALAAGLHPATVRAVIMAIVGSVAYLVRRESDTLSNLSLAAIIILLWRPESVFEVGFHLSLVVIVALTLFAARPREPGLVGGLKASSRTALVASIAAAPITALTFGFVSIAGLFANAVAVFVLAPVVALSMAAYCLMPIWTTGSEVLIRAAGTLTDGVGWLLDSAGTQSWTAIVVPSFSPYWLVLIYGVPLVAWRKHLRQP